MSKTTSHWGVPTLLLGILALPAGAMAETAETPAVDSPAYAAAVPEDSLADARGGELHLNQLNDLTENANLTDNQANGAVTGGNWVGDQVFSGASGFATVIQNSGNNVIIQDALILNISYVQ